MGETELLIQSVRELEESLSEKFAVEDGYIVERRDEGEKKDYLKLILRLQPVIFGNLLETVYLPLDQAINANLATLRSVVERPSILARGTPATGLIRGIRYRVEGDEAFEGQNWCEEWDRTPMESTIQSIPDAVKVEEKA